MGKDKSPDFDRTSRVSDGTVQERFSNGPYSTVEVLAPAVVDEDRVVVMGRIDQPTMLTAVMTDDAHPGRGLYEAPGGRRVGRLVRGCTGSGSDFVPISTVHGWGRAAAARESHDDPQGLGEALP